MIGSPRSGLSAGNNAVAGPDTSRIRVTEIVLQGILLLVFSSAVATWCSDGSDAGTGTDGDIAWSVNGVTLELSLKDGHTGAAMKDYSESSRPGWENDSGWSNVTAVTIATEIISIGEYAFYVGSGTSHIQSVTFGTDTQILSVGKYAFYNCTTLTTVSIPDGITLVSDHAFYGCTGITAITIPNNVASIGQYAFYGCTGLATVTFGAGVKAEIGIANTAFLGCDALTAFALTGTSSTLYVDDKGVLFNQNQTSIIRAPTQMVSQKASPYIIPNTVQTVGEYAFYGCSKIEYITYANDSWGITSIGKDAFSLGTQTSVDCTIHSPKNIAYGKLDQYCGKQTMLTYSGYGTDENISWEVAYRTLTLTGTTMKDYATAAESRPGWESDAGWSRVTAVEISSGITNVGNCAFYNCTGIQTVTVPDTVTSIGTQAFEGCSGMTVLSLPINVNCVAGSGAEGDPYVSKFAGCTSIQRITFTPGTTYDDHTAGVGINYGNDSRVLTPQYLSASSLQTAVFKNPSGTTAVTIIGTNTFYGVIGLNNVTIPETVTSIKDSAFEQCTSLTAASLPQGLTELGTYAFGNCTNLASLTIPISFNAVGTDQSKPSFYGCVMITAVSLIKGTGATDGYDYTIDNCIYTPWYITTRISSLTFEEGITSIGKYTFYGCVGITSKITLPGSLTAIDEYAFYGCSRISGTLVFSEGFSTLGEYAFYNCAGLNAIRSDKITTKLNLKIVSAHQFHGCSGLSYIGIEGVENIQDFAFCGCSGFDSIILPRSLVTIGESAFSGCASATGKLIISEKVTSIGQNAFYNCKNITGDLVLPDGTSNVDKTVGQNAFACANILTVTVGSSWNHIDNGAFPLHKFYNEDGTTQITNLASTNFIGHCFAGAQPEKMCRSNSVSPHKITYDVAGGDTVAPIHGDISTGIVFTVQAYSGMKEGYDFGGWYYGEQVVKEGDTITMENADITLRAYWIAFHNVKYIVSKASQPAPPQEDKEEGKEFTVQDYSGTREGYKFKGWSYDGTIYRYPDTITMGTKDIVLTAVWIQFHSVTYNVSGGSEKQPVQEDVLEGDTFTTQDYSGTKDGYAFDGWLYNGKIYAPSKIITMGTKDIVLTAHWTTTHAVVYDINGGTGDTPQTITVPEYAKFIVQDCTAVRENYVFSCWIYTDGKIGEKEYKPGHEMNMEGHDILLKAKWLPVHTVTFDPNGGSEAPSQKTVPDGERLMVPDYSGTREGYTFGGWQYNNRVYEMGGLIAVTKDITLTAIWIDNSPGSGGGLSAIHVELIVLAIGIVVIGIASFIIRRR